VEIVTEWLPSAPNHWAIVLHFYEGSKILLPLSLCLMGSSPESIITDELYLQGWTYDHAQVRSGPNKEAAYQRHIKEITKFYKASKPIFEMFHGSPVLHIADVEKLFHPSFSWRPRRYSTTWTLLRTIIHCSFKQKLPMSPIHGRYTDISLLVDDIHEIGSRVSFIDSDFKPFSRLKISKFRLQHTSAQEKAQMTPLIQRLKVQTRRCHRLRNSLVSK
jgi:hypothetical protein